MAITGMTRILTVLLTFTLSLGQVSAREFLRVCYFPSWANERASPNARYDISDIDPSLCTHIIYAFGKLDVDSKLLVATYPLVEDSRPGFDGRYKAFNKLKKRNSRLQTLLSVGGQNDNGDGFAAITENEVILTRFAKTTVDFLRKRNFDGIDIDWEYPNKDTRQRFVKLLKALREAFDAENTSQKLLLTIAGPAGKWTIDDGYDIPGIARYVDYVNLMTYDYTVKSAQVTAFNSPLFSRNDIRFSPVLSMNWTVHYWQQHGLPFSKMLVGMTGVGRRLVLNDTEQYDLGSQVTGEIRKGDYYGIEAGLAYPEICLLLTSQDRLTFYDYEQRCPYLVKGDDWVGYDDPQSITEKITWMMATGVAGFMFWSLDQDDFSGKMCDSDRYPLMNAMLKAIGVENEPELTENVDPDIRYLTKKESGATTTCFSHTHVVIATVFVFITMLL